MGYKIKILSQKIKKDLNVWYRTTYSSYFNVTFWLRALQSFWTVLEPSLLFLSLELLHAKDGVGNFLPQYHQFLISSVRVEVPDDSGIWYVFNVVTEALFELNILKIIPTDKSVEVDDQSCNLSGSTELTLPDALIFPVGNPSTDTRKWTYRIVRTMNTSKNSYETDEAWILVIFTNRYRKIVYLRRMIFLRGLKSIIQSKIYWLDSYVPQFLSF